MSEYFPDIKYLVKVKVELYLFIYATKTEQEFV